MKNTLKVVSVLLVLLCTVVSSGQCSSTSPLINRTLYTEQELVEIKNASLLRRKAVNAYLLLRVNDEIVFKAKRQVLRGTTPAELLALYFNVERGYVCSSEKDVYSVGKFTTDIEKGRYWVLYVNGSAQEASPHASMLNEGDIVIWEYVKGTISPTDHDYFSFYIEK